MAFVVPHDPLTPRRRLALDVAAGTKVLRAHELGAVRAAEQVIDTARVQAAAIVAAAEETLAAEGRRGFAQGTEKALRESAQHMTEQLARTHQYLDGVRNQLVDLVVKAMRRIVEGFDEPDLVMHAVRSALALVRNQKQLTLRVHPQHVDHVRAKTGELLAGYPGVDLLDVVADTRLAGDTCELESGIGTVRTSTKDQLAALQAALANVMSSHAPQS